MQIFLKSPEFDGDVVRKPLTPAALVNHQVVEISANRAVAPQGGEPVADSRIATTQLHWPRFGRKRGKPAQCIRRQPLGFARFAPTKPSPVSLCGRCAITVQHLLSFLDRNKLKRENVHPGHQCKECCLQIPMRSKLLPVLADNHSM